MLQEINDDLYPNSAIALIVSTWGSYTLAGSGALVGPNDVLTAAHLIYDASLGGLADEVKIYFSYDPDDTNFSTGYYEAAYAEYYINFDNNSDGLIYSGDGYYSTRSGSENDIAIIALKKYAGYTFGWFGLDGNFTSGNVNVTGHPSKSYWNMMHDSGFVYRDYVDNFIYTSSLDLSSGQSGSPIWNGSSSNPFVVGVVSTPGAAANVSGHTDWLFEQIDTNDSFVTTPYVPVTSSPANSIFRFYNDLTGAHFYTNSPDERDMLIWTQPVFNYEGFNFAAASQSNQFTVDVHRFFNRDTGAHFYTANIDEARNLLSSSNLKYDGVTYQAYDKQINLAYQGSHSGNDIVPLHRYLNNDTGTHFYTASSDELRYVNTLGHMTYEGVAYYVELL